MGRRTVPRSRSRRRSVQIVLHLARSSSTHSLTLAWAITGSRRGRTRHGGLATSSPGRHAGQVHRQATQDVCEAPRVFVQPEQQAQGGHGGGCRGVLRKRGEGLMRDAWERRTRGKGGGGRGRVRFLPRSGACRQCNTSSLSCLLLTHETHLSARCSYWKWMGRTPWYVGLWTFSAKARTLPTSSVASSRTLASRARHVGQTGKRRSLEGQLRTEVGQEGQEDQASRILV